MLHYFCPLHMILQSHHIFQCMYVCVYIYMFGIKILIPYFFSWVLLCLANVCYVSLNISLFVSDDEDVEQCVSREVHEKKAISGIAMKNGTPTPCSSIAGQQMAKFKNEIDMVKRKFSLTNSESSTSSSSSSSVDLSCLDNLTIRSIASQAKKKKM